MKEKIAFFTSFTAYFVFLLIFISCDSTPYKRESTGPKNTLTVVCDTNMYDNGLKQFLREDSILGQPYPGLIRKEPLIAIRNFSPRSFRNYPRTRNVLYIKKGAPSLFIHKDSLASPQSFILVSANNSRELKRLIQENKTKIIESLLETDYRFQSNYLSENAQIKYPNLIDLGIQKILLPKNYKLITTATDFVYYRKDQGIDIVNLIFSRNETLSHHSHSEQIKEEINRVYRQHLTDRNNRYPLIENHFPFQTEKKEEDSLWLKYESRGFWKMKNDLMGGPLIAQTWINKKTNKNYQVSAFIYAPHKPPRMNKKRDYLLEIETILRTLLLK